MQRVSFDQTDVGRGLNEPHAAEFVESSAADRLAQVEAELVSLQLQLRNDQQLKGSKPNSAWCGDNINCRPYKFRGGADVILFKPRFEDGAEEDSALHVLDFHLDAAPRIWLESVRSDCLGLRSRYWHYTHGSAISTVAHVPITGTQHQMLLDAYTIDVEVAKFLDFHNWQLVLGTGFRYAWLEQQVMATDTGDFVLKRYNAIGPMFALDTRHQIGRNFACLANVRTSILVGESKWSTSANEQTTDDIGANLDMQLGLEWLCRYPDWGELFIRLLWEQQHWFGAGTHFSGTNTVGNGIFALQPDDHDVAFMGFGLAAGTVR